MKLDNYFRNYQFKQADLAPQGQSYKNYQVLLAHLFKQLGAQRGSLSRLFFRPASAPSPYRSFSQSEFSRDIQRAYPTQQALVERVQACRKSIFAAKEQFLKSNQPNPLAKGLSAVCSASKKGVYHVETGRLQLIEEGISGSYFLSDQSGNKRYVVKPLDEDAGCLNNPKKFASPLEKSPVRDNMPLYRSGMREAAAYQTAQLLGVSSIAPQTSLTVLASDRFHDIEGVSQVQEKLCSVQEFVPGTVSLAERMQELQARGYSGAAVESLLDQNDVEDVHLLLWATGDTDAHAGNFLTYEKKDAHGKIVYGLKKIDNGLAFPDQNGQFRNHLGLLPHAKRPLSAQGKAKIAAMNPDALAQKLTMNGMESAIPAMRERVQLVKTLAQRPGVTLDAINRAMKNQGTNRAVTR